jgi:hypothetical protein
MLESFTEAQVLLCVSDLRHVDGFLQVVQFPQPIKLTTISGGSRRGGQWGHSPPSSIKKIAFIHSPVNCNKSLYILTRCIALLVYLITFELLKQSTINQKTK